VASDCLQVTNTESIVLLGHKEVVDNFREILACIGDVTRSLMSLLSYDWLLAGAQSRRDAEVDRLKQ
jgi:hypothetical protein